MCTVSVEIDEVVLRGINPNLDSTAALRRWAQQLIDLHTQEMLADDTEAMYALQQDMTPDQLYDVIAEEIDSIYANN